MLRLRYRRGRGTPVLPLGDNLATSKMEVQGARTIQWGKSCPQMVLGQLDSHVGKKEVGSLSHTIYKVIQIIDLIKVN